MSTVTTSSPSPAASPQSSFHIARQPSSDRLPRTSPQVPFTSSPRRPFYAPPPRPVVSVARDSSIRRQRESSSSGSRSSLEGTRVRYAHASTQYSPEGLPPTARGAAVRSNPTQPPGSTGSTGRKRKERGSHDEDDMPSASGVVDDEAASSAPPPEPEPRLNPSTTTVGSSSAAGGSEPREARSTHGHSATPKRSRPAPGNAKEMPLRYWLCNPKDLGVLISSMLMELIRLNDQIPLRDGRLTRFHSRAPPGISVSDYLQRLIHHATLSPPILLSMVWYIDRLCQLYPAFTINSLTVHRFLITAATVAAKGLSDSFWTNPTYAKIGGIPVTELATLELEFLQKVEWKIVPKPESLEDYYRSLVERTEGYKFEQSSSSASESSSSSSGGSENDGDGDEVMADDPRQKT